jgi:chromosome segregation ATPase
MDEKIQQVLNELETNLQEIDSAVKHIDKAGEVSKEVTQSVKDLQHSYKESLQKIHELLDNKEENRDKKLKEYLSSVHSELEEHLSSNQQRQEEHFKKVDEFLEEKEKLLNQVQELRDYIDSVDFPNRLDKLDNTTSSINVSIQNLQTSISEFKKEIKESIGEQLNSVQADQSRIIQKQDKQQNILIGLCALVALITVLGLAKILA